MAPVRVMGAPAQPILVSKARKSANIMALGREVPLLSSQIWQLRKRSKPTALYGAHARTFLFSEMQQHNRILEMAMRLA